MSVSRQPKSLRGSSCTVMLRLACDYIIKGHKIPDVLSSNRVPNNVPTPVLVHQRPCLSPRSSASVACGGAGWRDRQRVCFVLGVAVVGKISACDSVVCVCLSSASLNKQWLAWPLPCEVFTVELGRVRERVQKGKGSEPSTTTTGLAGRAGFGKRRERSSES